MSFIEELKTIRQIALAPIRGATHAERLESFYKHQSEGYDAFREKLLQGRRELFEQALKQMAPLNRERPVWVDLGAGTGRNLEFVKAQLSTFGSIHLVDLSPSLLEVATKRIAKQNWKQVQVHQADASSFDVQGGADLVTFSYSLSMIPDWFKALENAYRLLKPSGVIGVVDFFVSRKHPAPNRARHSWWTRTFWPTWFAADGVQLSSEGIEYLQWKFETLNLEESSAKVPWVPLGEVPYYRFLGRKRDTGGGAYSK